jgi:hypothetical protein
MASLRCECAKAKKIVCVSGKIVAARPFGVEFRERAFVEGHKVNQVRERKPLRVRFSQSYPA